MMPQKFFSAVSFLIIEGILRAVQGFSIAEQGRNIMNLFTAPEVVMNFAAAVTAGNILGGVFAGTAMWLGHARRNK